MWLSWSSGRLWHQRSEVWILSSAEFSLQISCVTQWKEKRGREWQIFLLIRKYYTVFSLHCCNHQLYKLILAFSWIRRRNHQTSKTAGTNKLIQTIFRKKCSKFLANVSNLSIDWSGTPPARGGRGRRCCCWCCCWCRWCNCEWRFLRMSKIWSIC